MKLQPGWIFVTMAACHASMVVDQFDGHRDYKSWLSWWGGAMQVFSDGYPSDSGDDPSSGSFKAEVYFDHYAHGGDNQFSLIRLFEQPANLSQFNSVRFDLLWEPWSALSSSGHHGVLEVGFVRYDYSQVMPMRYVVTTNSTGRWVRVRVIYDPNIPGLKTSRGICMRMGPLQSGSMSGKSTFFLDNVVLEAADPSTAARLSVTWAGDSVVLQWDASSGGLVPEFSGTTGGPWETIVLPVNQTGSRLTVPVPVSMLPEKSSFFRLVEAHAIPSGLLSAPKSELSQYAEQLWNQ